MLIIGGKLDDSCYERYVGGSLSASCTPVGAMGGDEATRTDTISEDSEAPAPPEGNPLYDGRGRLAALELVMEEQRKRRSELGDYIDRLKVCMLTCLRHDSIIRKYQLNPIGRLPYGLECVHGFAMHMSGDLPACLASLYLIRARLLPGPSRCRRRPPRGAPAQLPRRRRGAHPQAAERVGGPSGVAGAHQVLRWGGELQGGRGSLLLPCGQFFSLLCLLHPHCPLVSRD